MGKDEDERGLTGRQLEKAIRLAGWFFSGKKVFLGLRLLAEQPGPCSISGALEITRRME